MKRGKLLFCVLMLLGSRSVLAAGYELEAANSHNKNFSFGDGTWGDWQHCEDYSGANSAPKSFTIYVLKDVDEFQKAFLDCRQIKADGTLNSSGKDSDNFFASPGSGDAEKTQTATSLTKLPVGLTSTVSTGGTDLSIFATHLLVLEAAEIEWWSRAISVESYAGSERWGKAFEDLQCDLGYVMTGMKLKTLDGDEGKFITGVRIKCTKLLKK